ncbi:hypothetical protein [Candidatus Protochlamydia amoebophila]|uniref:Uncharacterized protein n=1 Tax=Protochlamydia amoebophila (strain UWE25) TaxID=264201 RepID=A0A2P9H9Y3_PARUW|nr:hypothetical protein [Candidatus Protochlamydia amoebophila]SPJ31818.1 unnamed protein product [Candidatus Protochlamydia amoebophila UWE25]
MQVSNNDFEEQPDPCELQWNRPFYTLKNELFIPVVLEESMILPAGFNTKTIYLDGRLKADLKWKGAREEALKAIEAGAYLFWDINIGLMDDLPFALINQTQYLSLSLSLEHFRDSLWKEFKHKTIGISLYKGSADFSLKFPWDAHQIENLKEWIAHLFKDEIQLKEETGVSVSSLAHLTVADFCQTEQGQQLIRLFCRDVSMEYISLLISRLPDTLPAYLFLDVTHFANHPLYQMQLLHPARFEQFNLALKGFTLPFFAWGWQSQATSLGYSGIHPLPIPPNNVASIGICIPPLFISRPSQFKGLEQALKDLLAQAIPFRLIAEEHLITGWDGLDYLIYTPTGLSGQGKRKLQGFCAAGGTAISTSDLIGLDYEITYETFMAAPSPKSEGF